MLPADTDPILASLAPYIPGAVLRKLEHTEAHALPAVEPVRGAILLLDIAGFTPIVVSLSGAGPRGIDALQRLLTSYYTEMIDVVKDHGGDIYQFAGDSILACFEPAPGEEDAGVVQRAARCALGVQRRLMRFAQLELLGQRFSVSSRIGIGFGESHRIVLGATGMWMHPALVGQPLEQAVKAEKRATVGEVLLSAEAWALLPDATRRGEPRDGAFRLEPSAPLQAQPPPSFTLTGRDDLVGRCALLLHPVLFTKITTAHQEFRGDFRDVTCFFLRFTNTSKPAQPEDFTRELNAFYEYVQRESAHHGGVLLMTDFTDKGNVLYVIFGAPTALQNKEVLASRLACKILRERENFPFVEELQIGIATGHAYFGDMGSPWRKGYSALGEVVNMAARLMTHGRGTGIHIDANTERKLQQNGFATDFVENAKLKGVARAVPVYRLQAEVRRSLFIKGKGDIVGRLNELKALREAVEESIAGSGRVCVVSGEAGIGKSRLGAKVVEEAEERGARSLYGICYSYEMFTPFFPWKEVLVQIFGLHDGDDLETQLSQLHLGFEGLEDTGPEWIPVLAGILGLPVEEGPVTRELDARRKNQKLFQIILQLLEKLARQQPVLLFFEDLHWADNISVDLIEYIAARLSSLRVTLLVTMRPGEQLKNLKGLPGLHRLDLSNLDDEDTRALLRLHLRMEPPDTALEDLLLAKVQGNPFFTESIVQGLVEGGYLGPVSPGSERMERKRGLQALELPDSIQDVVLTRIDLLSETEKLVVKVASVIGRIFTLEAVAELAPGSIPRRTIREAIDTLTKLGLILLEVEEPFTCIFKHIVIRDVAYNTLLVSAREDLHRRMARFIEARAGDNPVKSAGILAYHSLAGNDEVKGLEYTLMAARSAREQYANDDAIHHYNRAMEVLGGTTALEPDEVLLKTRKVMQELAETLLQAGNYAGAIHMFEQCLADEDIEARKAEIHLGLGRAYQEKGESKRAIQELETALVLMGRTMPRNLVALGVRTVLALGLHLLYGLFPWLVRPLGSRLPLYLKQLSTLISLIKIYYFADIAKLTWATMVAATMAERSRSEYGMSLASNYYGSLLFGSGLLKRSGVWCNRALEHARRSRDSAAEGIALSRLATLNIFTNEQSRATQYGEEAVALLRQVGDMWEVQTGLMMLATSQFLASRFESAEQAYREMGRVGVQLNALMHQGWAHAWVPMCRYLRGDGDVGELCAELEEGLRISIEVQDLANQCASLNHLVNVAVREHQVEEAALMAVRADEALWRYHVLVPFLQIGLVDAAEGALFALEQGATAVPKEQLWAIVRRCAFKARALGKLYPYLRGPALRVTARAKALKRGAKAAEPLFERALKVLEATPNRWETGVAYHDAAVALPHRRAELLARAREVFLSIDAKAELRRVEQLEAAGATGVQVAAAS
ncbi:AAA family ATPase [Pyxidicoccus parkwayensis]|uniref:AAA family ATPase n=1 Tax=Pyxidicoccus parkwayensis TaxID=2813578 RepID=A0ABX7P3Z1_9BACT|nr:adenylate/guanylate cyclase domain-containing protein [Pyxidicoccus parkwaysis]QSQ25151.1 AAA family ATPase [Pyxidicoccus parkwaysis]